MRNNAIIRVALACGLALALSAAPAGCKAVRKWFAPAEGIALGDPDAAPASSPRERQGLGVRLLVVDDTDYDAARSLRGYAPLRDASVQSRWARWGFRVVEVPVGDVEMLISSLRAVQPMSVQFMGEFGHWRPLVRSGPIQQSSVQVGDSTRSVEPGRPRLIARAWAEPRLTDSGIDQVLRLDLGMQIESRSQNAYQLLPTQGDETLDDKGRVIDELLSTIRLDGRHAVVIVGEAPGTDWSRLPEPRSALAEIEQLGDQIGPEAEDEQETEEAEQEEPEPFRAQESSRAVIEPSVPRSRSLGELMLNVPGSRLVRANEARRIPKRVVIVLTPELVAQDITGDPSTPAQGDDS